MATQTKFKKSFLEKIKQLAKDKSNIQMFAAETFDYTKQDLVSMHGINHPTNLLEDMMSAKNEFEAALALYKAYENITPLIASDEAFWAYLALVELNPYARKRFASLANPESPNVILARYFAQERIVKNVIARLWWAVYMSEKGKEDIDRFSLTSILFSHTELFDTLTQSRLFRYKNATIGILSFFAEHSELITRANTLKAMKFFNRVGGARELSAMPESFFKKELSIKFSNQINESQINNE
ncbi:MAG: DUF6339 family protein [Bacteroidaceae bacterium]|nr:DUF6339 family protein [Bacteroidaceae bacterium]